MTVMPDLSPLPIWQRGPYRVSQFLRGLTATVSAAERQSLQDELAPAALELFLRLPVDAQRHSLNVMQTLRDAGYDDPDLMAAALLHDVGKAASEAAGVRLQLWVRGPLVLADGLLPGLLTHYAAARPEAGWRYALYVHLHHPAIGAAWARHAQCSALTCWLIEHHQDKTAPAESQEGALLAALQWADERN